MRSVKVGVVLERKLSDLAASTDSSSVGSFGRNSQGGERVLSDWETVCAEFVQDTSQTCP